MKPQKKYLAAVALGVAATAGYFYAFAAAIFNPDVQPIGYVSMNALSNNKVDTGTEKMYVVDYNNTNWSGNLHSYSVTAAGNIATTEDWVGGAQGQLDAQATRFIATIGSAGTGAPFTWASLSVAQKTALGTATTGPKILEYIRGSRAEEAPAGLRFRPRAHLLGDIIHSTPVFSIDQNGQKTVFVGANDGMLHAFNAVTGAERWAYIPLTIQPKLKDLSANPYVHKYFVDGRLAVKTMTNNSGVTKTILVGTTGAGGTGIFALDVSDVTAASDADVAAKVLWDIDNVGDFADLGYTYATPALVNLDTGTRPAVVIGNGYNNTGNNHSMLYMIDAFTGARIARIDTGLGNTGGLSTASFGDTDRNGFVDLAFAGDIDGNLWEFDLVGKVNKRKLFTTDNNSGGSPEAITTAPSVSRHPSGGFMVNFTTGRILSSSDTGDTSTHYAYGIWTAAPAANTTLLNQTLTEVNYTGVTPNLRTRTATSLVPNWNSGGHKGWRTTLPIGGERLVGDGAYATDGNYVFSTTNPSIAGGENWSMQLNSMTGGQVSSIRIDLDGNAQFNAADQVTGGINPVGVMFGNGIRSQAVALNVGGFNVYTINKDKNLPPPAVTSGVDGGHFDVDRYCGAASTRSSPAVVGFAQASCKHKHEYDDTYNVTGVNFLNASEPLLNLSNGLVASPFVFDSATQFKVLVMNQALSPAVYFTIGGNDYQKVLDIPYAKAASAAAVLTGAPNYNYDNISSFGFNMPIDAFSSQDWGTGDIRAGVIPTKTGCVKDENRAGPNGEWRNGALTFQIIRATTPASALQLNVGGRQDLGWRLNPTAANMTAYWLGEYTVFWHESGICYGDSSWTQTPDTVNSPPTRATQPPGTDDPKTFIAPPTPTPTPPPCEVAGTCAPTTGCAIAAGCMNINSTKSGRVNWRELRQ
jgi:type IV pilus assembly protein PilY1